MLYKLKDRAKRAAFGLRCRGILDTLPVALNRTSSLLVLSQLQHKDLLMYLLALKSFAQRIDIGGVAVLNDGSLTADDLDTLRYHVPGIELLSLESFRSDSCPRGGTWERILAICERAQDRYVVQLDSDTLTLADIDEVKVCIREGCSFTIGTWDKQTFEPMSERVRYARQVAQTSPPHVQIVAEANFDRLKRFNELRYVRGCSGFAGFSRKSVTRSFVEAISAEMSGALGSKWSEWGSEQVMSNIAVANAPRATVLPHPKYADCHKVNPTETAFVHFIGSCRFSGGAYAHHARSVIEALARDRTAL